jgi:hypothetical protein
MFSEFPHHWIVCLFLLDDGLIVPLQILGECPMFSLFRRLLLWE